MLEHLVPFVLDNLGPGAIFGIVCLKLYLDHSSKKREMVNGRDPKDVTRDKIGDLGTIYLDGVDDANATNSSLSINKNGLDHE